MPERKPSQVDQAIPPFELRRMTDIRSLINHEIKYHLRELGHSIRVQRDIKDLLDDSETVQYLTNDAFSDKSMRISYLSSPNTEHKIYQCMESRGLSCDWLAQR